MPTSNVYVQKVKFFDCYVAYQGKMVMVWCIQQKAAKMKPYVISYPVQQHHKMMLLLFDGGG